MPPHSTSQLSFKKPGLSTELYTGTNWLPCQLQDGSPLLRPATPSLCLSVPLTWIQDSAESKHCSLIQGPGALWVGGGRRYKQAGLVKGEAIASAQSLWSRRAQTPKSQPLVLSELVSAGSCTLARNQTLQYDQRMLGGLHLPLLLPKNQDFAERTVAPLGLEGISLLPCPSLHNQCSQQPVQTRVIPVLISLCTISSFPLLFNFLCPCGQFGLSTSAAPSSRSLGPPIHWALSLFLGQMTPFYAQYWGCAL